ncbi:hypothetical protein FACS1894191_1420 [Clostridia bacterium]|nr:hypothetical protein FACS1894191_1420 [Clostridia bacterium]
MQDTKKILIVEDNKDLAGVYQSRFDLEGFTTFVVFDGEKALATATEFVPDLTLLDIMLPEINGFDVLDILKNTPKTKHIKVVMLTALSQPQDKERALLIGADDYLIKSKTSLNEIVDCAKKHLLA